MSRILLLCMAVWLSGFAAAAVTAPNVAPAALVTGTVGLLATLVCVAVLCASHDGTVGGGG